MQKKSTLIDGFLMASVRIIILVFSILITMVLSRFLPLVDFGTYSTGNLIINTAIPISAIGLLDAVNYYYNSQRSNRDTYVNTVFFILLALGSLVAIIILLFQNSFTAYFHNPKLATIYIYIALRPLLDNLNNSVSTLHLSIGHARFVAIRNFLFSFGKLVCISVISITTQNVTVIFQSILILEFFALTLNFYLLKKDGVKIQFHKCNLRLLPEILSFCLPMGIYIQASSLAKSLDLFVIGWFETTERLAIYTNCATHLPINFIPLAFLTVLMPKITRYVQNRNISSGIRIMQNFIKVSYMTTWALGTACIVLAPQAINFLYGSKYLDGSPIFILSILSSMFCFPQISIFLSANGDTKTLMWVSLGTLFANLIFNFLSYFVIGFIGPAVVTLIVMTASSMVLIQKGAAIFGRNIWHMFHIRHMLNYLACCVLLGGCTYVLRLYLEKLQWHPTAILILCGILCSGSIFIANYRKFVHAFTGLTQND